MAQNVWDLNAPEWARRVAAQSDHSRQHVLIPALVAALRGISSPGQLVLDVGCGSAGITALLGTTYRQRVIGLDSSLAMCREAVAQLHNGVHSIVCASVTELPFTDGSFDIVVANMVFSTIPDLTGACAEISRVLKPAGHLIFSILHPARVAPVVLSGEFDSASIGTVDHYPDERQIGARIKVGGTTWLPAIVPYHHRMLATYSSALRLAGLLTLDLMEPLPDADSRKRYPQMEAFWMLAPFLVWTVRRT